ncbi:MAG: hypothetical protein PME_23260 [Priestia megaterium]
MEIHEALDILQRIAASYTQFDLTGEIGERRIEVWSSHLMKMPYKPVLERVNQHILREKFPQPLRKYRLKSKQITSSWTSSLSGENKSSRRKKQVITKHLLIICRQNCRKSTVPF